MGEASLWRRARPLFLARATAALLGLALPLVLARTLEATAFGTYKQLFLVAGLALHALQFGLAQSVCFLLPRTDDPRERTAVLRQTHALLALVGVVAGAALLLLAPRLGGWFDNPQLTTLGAPLGLLTAALVASAPLELALLSQGRTGLSALALVLNDTVRLVAMLLPLGLGFGVEGLAWGAALATLLRWLASLATCLPRAHPATRARLAGQLAWAMPFGLAVLVTVPQAQLHQLFAASAMPPDTFALYAVGCLQLPLVSLLQLPVTETLQVRLASDAARDPGPFLEATELLTRLLLPLCALVASAASPALALLYGPAYAEAGSVLALSMLGTALVAFPAETVLKSTGGTRTLLAAALVRLLVTWPLLGFGFRAAGLEGIIAAHVLVELGSKAVLLHRALAVLGLGARDLAARARVGRSLLVALCTAALTHAALVATSSAGAGLVLAGLLSLAFVSFAFRLRRGSSVDGAT